MDNQNSINNLNSISNQTSESEQQIKENQNIAESQNINQTENHLILNTECYQKADDYYQNPDLNHMNYSGIGASGANSNTMSYENVGANPNAMGYGNSGTNPNSMSYGNVGANPNAMDYGNSGANPNLMGYENPGGMYPQQINYNPKEYISPEDNKKANMFCWISLGLFLAPILLAVVFEAANSIFDINYLENAGNISSEISGLFYIGALVFMIIVRVKYPKNVFGKVLMWTYIVLTVISIITMVAMIIACSIACNACMNEMQGCGSIGFVLLHNLFGN